MSKLPAPSDIYALPPTVGYTNHDVRKQRLPQYSFGVRSKMTGKSLGPGPAEYDVSNLVRYGVTRANKYSIAKKNNLQGKSKSPGPMTYNLRESPDFGGTRPLAYSIAKRSTISYKNFVPGPNIYGINTNSIKPTAPKYSIGVKKFLANVVQSPGPARYSRTNIAIIKPGAPAYSIAKRTDFKSKICGPGSNAYDRSYYRPGKRSPTYTFGIRHAPRSGTMIVPCDNM